MVVADLVVVFWLVFLLAHPADYDRALLVSLFSLQLTHVYFGRGPAILKERERIKRQTILDRRLRHHAQAA